LTSDKLCNSQAHLWTAGD